MPTRSRASRDAPRAGRGWHRPARSREPRRPGPMKHQKAYRAVFRTAGEYNILWGIYAIVDPQWFFRLTGLPRSNTPQIFATLGMVLGLYGILYLDVARRPTQGWMVAAVALTGKILGPLGLAWLILTGTWPPDTVILVLTNDLIWWIPFAWYLRDAWPAFRHGGPSSRRMSLSVTFNGAALSADPNNVENA